MDQHEAIDNHAATDAEAVSSAYVPSFQLTEGQPPPIAANGGRSYMSLDRDGDAGTAAAFEAAFKQIADGRAQAFIDELENAPPGPIETEWGIGFRKYGECLDYIRANNIEAPEGGLALPLRYTVYEEPSYSVVTSNSIWRDPARKADCEMLRKAEDGLQRRNLYFPQVMRDARRIGEYHPGLAPDSPECMDRLGVSLAHLESKCTNFYDSKEVQRVFYPEIEKLLLEFFPGATDALVYNHDVFNKEYEGDRTEDQAAKNPGRQRAIREPRAQRPERQQRPGPLPRAADQEPPELRARAALHGGGGRREDVAPVHVDQPREADGDRAAVPLRAVRLAVVRGPALHHELPHLRRSRGRDDPLHLPARPRVVLVPAADADRGLDAQVLRLRDGRLRLAMVLPHGLHRPDHSDRRAVPQERRGSLLRVLLEVGPNYQSANVSPGSPAVLRE